MYLTKKAMLASLNIKLLGMSRVDFKATRDANIHLCTSIDSGKYQKCRIHRSDVRDILKVAEYARDKHRKLTTPFDKIWNLLPSTLLLEYTAEMRDCKQKFNLARKDIENKWKIIVDKQAKRLGPLFRYNEYPFVYKDVKNSSGYVVDTTVDLSPYYYFDHQLSTVPSKDHVIIDIENETLEEIKNEIEQREIEKLKINKLSILKRLIEPVQNIADICVNDKKVFESLVENLEQVIDVLTELNVANDADVATLIKETKDHLCGFTPGQIRNDKNLKRDLGNKAQMLSQKMNVIMKSGATIN